MNDLDPREIMRRYYDGLMAEQTNTRKPYTDDEVESPAYKQVNQQRQRAGMPPINNRVGRRIPTAISLTEDEIDKLRTLAADWGYLHAGRGNISAFVAAIALGNFNLEPNY